MCRRLLVSVCLVAVLAVLAACSDDGGADGAAPPSIDTTTSSTTEPSAPETLRILVTNDDGIGAPGIDVLVNALLELPDVEVTVVAPAENQSSTSDTTTAGAVSYAAASTASGVSGTAVDGYPADTITVALDELGLTPHVVVSGVNGGQNIGPLVAISGTVGAGRESIRRGVPAVAASAGLEAETADYTGAAAFVVDWITAHRAELAAGTLPADAVVSFNVPTCIAGTTDELLAVPVAVTIPDGVDVFHSDCTLTPSSPPADDVTAIIAGHATVSDVPAEL